METLNFKNRGLKYDLELRKRLTIIKGDTATGKSLFSKAIKDYIMQYKENGKVRVLDYTTIQTTNEFKLFIKQIKGKLIVIDNADILLNKEIVEVINNDIKNKYIIMSRRDGDFRVSPNAIAELAYDSNIKQFSLKYKFEILGW